MATATKKQSQATGRVEVLKIHIPYTARPLQELFHRQARRWNVVVAHRRYGKTVLAINELLRRMIECPHKHPQGAYIANTYSQAKRVAWKYLKEYAGVLPGFTVNEAELRVSFQTGTGIATIYCLGGENYEGLRGLYLDFCILDEFADMPPPLLPQVIRPALADRQGGYLIIGTPKGHNLFWEQYDRTKKMESDGHPDYHAVIHRASETGILPQEELDAMKASMSPEEYEQELECSFEAAIRGAYYSKALEELRSKGRVKDIGHDPALPVHTGWDLGMSDSTAIWFAQEAPGREMRIFDYYEASGEPLAHYVSVLMRRDYVYGRHFLPHDVMVQDLSSGKSRYEMLRALGVRPTVVAKLPVKDGIEAARMLLPRCWFDYSQCNKGLEALAQYRAQWDERGQRWRTQPVHDWTSHAADAFRSLAVGLRDGSKEDLAMIATKNRLLGGGHAVITDYAEI